MLDRLRLDAPALKAELELLKSMKVGDVRSSLLMPAIESEMQWVCTAAEKDRWAFDVTFYGKLLFTADIVLTSTHLQCELKEVV